MRPDVTPEPITPGYLRTLAQQMDDTPATGLPSFMMGEASRDLRRAADLLERLTATLRQGIDAIHGSGEYPHAWAYRARQITQEGP